MQPIAPGRGGSRKLPQQEVGARPECVKEGIEIYYHEKDSCAFAFFRIWVYCNGGDSP